LPLALRLEMMPTTVDECTARGVCPDHCQMKATVDEGIALVKNDAELAAVFG
jgi:hypothetical protein